LDKDLEMLFEKSLGRVSGKAFLEMNKENIMKEMSPEKGDFFVKLEEFERMINSNF